MFRFINCQGRQAWVKLHTVICIYENEERNGLFTVQTIGSVWTVNKPTVMRLLAKLKAREQAEDDDDPDWWKHGRPNPLDREDDEST